MNIPFLKELFGSRRKRLHIRQTYECGAAKLAVGIIGRHGDESCLFGGYKLLTGKIRYVKHMVVPLTEKAEILYILRPGPGSWYKETDTVKIILKKHLKGKRKILDL